MNKLDKVIKSRLKGGYCYRELESEFIDFSCDNCPEKLFLTDKDIKEISKKMENKNE